MIADLEDAVASSEKASARRLVARVFGEIDSRCARTVRVNGADTEFFEEDLASVAGLELDAIVLPKATPEAVVAVQDLFRGLTPEHVPILAIVESARGLRLAYEIAERPGVVALVLGAADLGAELGLEPRPDGQEILYARGKLVVDSAAAGLRAPIDVVHLDIGDDAGVEAEALLARSLGFGGKMCIHPAQLPVVNRVFAPSAEQFTWARAVVGAYEEGLREGRGAVALDGKLVDLPVAERARKILELAASQDGGAGHDPPLQARFAPPDRPMEAKQ